MPAFKPETNITHLSTPQQQNTKHVSYSEFHPFYLH
jgi:hypothetical protein